MCAALVIPIPLALRAKSDPVHNRLAAADEVAHSWYRFNLSFPAHLVREYLTDFGMQPGCRVLDPFSGTGTTIVECKRRGIDAEGIEANPMAAFASSVKTDWSLSPRAVNEFADEVAEAASRQLEREEVPDADPLAMLRPHRASPLRVLPEESASLLLANSISPRPLHKALVLLEHIDARPGRRAHRHARLALARVLVESASNLHFGPEVGVGPPKSDAAVVEAWVLRMREMAAHLTLLRNHAAVGTRVQLGDSRVAISFLERNSIDAVFTSPPYPNEKDYTRTTRLLDIFSGAACYSLQSHLRSTAPGIGQIEIDEVYVGVDRSGVHFVFPVQAKGGKDKIGVVQIEQDMALCKAKFAGLICRPIAAQFLADDVIALFEFVEQDGRLKVREERHYRLVGVGEVTAEDLRRYRLMLPT